MALYPEIEPYNTHYLPTGEGHVLHVEECGNPNGIPVVFLHGGPGGYCKPYQRSLFNPDLYRIILFDQRGAGQSIPKGSLQANTAQELVKDIELLRQKLNIEQWVIFGGSWGSALGLLYAQGFPDRILSMILRGIFLARQKDIQWLYSEFGVGRLFPAQWQLLMSLIPVESHKEPLPLYYELLMSQDDDIAQMAALNWANWVGCVVSHNTFPAPVECTEEMLREVRIECHYAVNQFFVQKNQIIQNMDKLQDIPSIIIHGQQDLMCPLEGACTLNQAWEHSELKILPNGGHLTNEPETLAAIVQATDEMSEMLAEQFF